MEIINEIQVNNFPALRLFTSDASARKNNLRIHYHSLIEISLILEGRGIYKINGKTHTINEGDVFFFRPNEAHCITDIEENGMKLLNIHISPYYLYTNFQNALNSNYVKILSSAFSLLSNKINDTLDQEIMNEIKSLFLSIKNEMQTRSSDYLTVVINNISTILILFSRVYKDAIFSHKEKQSYKKILTAIDYIDNNFKQEVTLDLLCEKVNYSRCYFSSTFKKCMGMSLWDYLCIKRIECALNLIKTTDKNLLDIALECGFNNTVNFNKLFKKYTNLSPSAFRQS
ncbi:MAG: AraC family transcriptional regulator [Clostridiales bacterium]|nr:AraC family transcriptional regulator [Clostridiales bacterium]